LCHCCCRYPIYTTGTLLWAPLLGAVVLAVLQPTRAEIAARQEAAVEQAVAATEIRMSRQLPVTPVESAAWMNRLMQDMWAAFWQPFLLANNLSMWQVRCGSINKKSADQLQSTLICWSSAAASMIDSRIPRCAAAYGTAVVEHRIVAVYPSRQLRQHVLKACRGYQHPCHHHCTA
jgi:hypothetical protein